MKVQRGRIVHTHGPWSAGHQEQCAIVTNVFGDGGPGSLVNLYVFIDEGMPLIFNAVPWYPTRGDGVAAQTAHGPANGGAQFCYFPEREEAQ